MEDIDDTLSQAFDTAMAEPEEAVNEVTEEAEIAEELEPEVTEEVAEEQTDEVESEGEPEALEPPARWSKEDKDAFAALDRASQELVLKREKDVESYLTKGSQQIAETRKRFEALEQVLEGRRETIAREGMNEADYVQQLFSISDYAANNPAEFIQWFAQQRGVDLTQLNAGTQGTTQRDPALLQTQQELASIKQLLNQQTQAQQDAAQRQAQAQIDKFATSGNAPYFDKVQDAMAKLIESGEAQDLEDAYEQAIWKNKEVRAELMKSEEEKKMKEAKAKAAKAKKAAGLKLDSSGESSVAATGSIDDTLSEVYDRLTA